MKYFYLNNNPDLILDNHTLEGLKSIKDLYLSYDNL